MTVRRISPIILALASSLIFFSLPLSVAASSTPGSKCTKIGALAKSGTTSLKCVKSGGKLIWQKVVVARPKPRSTPASKTSPSPITSKSATETAYAIHVNSNQWSWEFSYSKTDTKANLSAAPSDWPVLYIPEGKLVRFTLTSADVPHGFSIPALMIDVKISPDAASHLEFTADKIGTYPGRCNISCGREHSAMIFTVKVVTPAEYLTYLSTLKTD